MHRHLDREGVLGASGWWEGHVQVPGLNPAVATSSPRLLFVFSFFVLPFFKNLCLSNKVRIPLSGGHVVSVTMWPPCYDYQPGGGGVNFLPSLWRKKPPPSRLGHPVYMPRPIRRTPTHTHTFAQTLPWCHIVNTNHRLLRGQRQAPTSSFT